MATLSRPAARATATLAALALSLGPAAAATAVPVDDQMPSGDASLHAAAEDEPVPGTLKGGVIAQSGWWGFSNRQIPETGLVAPPSTPPFLSPTGSLPVAGIGGNVERITAIGFAIDGKTDGTVERLELAISEVDDPTANPNAANGLVTACTLTEGFWVAVSNGPWDTAPTYDCAKGAAAGVRDAETGIWTFDLTALAADWLSSDREFATAVVLVSEPDPNAPEAEPGAQSAETFQVAFNGVDGIGLVAQTKGPKKSGGGGGDNTGGDNTGNDAGGGDLGGGDLGGGDIPLPTDPIPVDPAPVVEPDGVPESAPVQAASPQVTNVAATPLSWYDGIGRTGLLVIPVLMLAYLVMVAMGPAGQPVAVGSRRGVSRALDRLAQGGVTRLGRKS